MTEGLISISARQGDKYHGTITIRIVEYAGAHDATEITVAYADFARALTGEGFQPCCVDFLSRA